MLVAAEPETGPEKEVDRVLGKLEKVLESGDESAGSFFAVNSLQQQLVDLANEAFAHPDIFAPNQPRTSRAHHLMSIATDYLEATNYAAESIPRPDTFRDRITSLTLQAQYFSDMKRTGTG